MNTAGVMEKTTPPGRWCSARLMKNPPKFANVGRICAKVGGWGLGLPKIRKGNICNAAAEGAVQIYKRCGKNCQKYALEKRIKAQVNLITCNFYV